MKFKFIMAPLNKYAFKHSVKSKFRRSFRTRKFTKRFKGKKTWMGARVSKKIAVNVPLYYYTDSSGRNFYTFDVSVSQTTSQLNQNLYALLKSNETMKAMSYDFAFFKVSGFSFKWIPGFFDAGLGKGTNPPVFLPPVAFDTIGYFVTDTLVPSNIYSSDSSMKVNMSTHDITSKYYSPPGLIETQNGYPVMGNCWFDVAAFMPSSSTSYVLNLVLGYNSSPSPFTSGQITTKLGELIVTFYTQWCKPIKTRGGTVSFSEPLPREVVNINNHNNVEKFADIDSSTPRTLKCMDIIDDDYIEYLKFKNMNKK